MASEYGVKYFMSSMYYVVDMYSLNSTLTSAEELCLGEEETECEEQQRRPQLGHGDGDGVSGPGLGPVLQRPSLYVATSSVIRGYGGYNGLAGVINTRLYCRIRQINCPRPVYYLPALFIQRVTISIIRGRN